jgi:hypothetical protein
MAPAIDFALFAITQILLFLLLPTSLQSITLSMSLLVVLFFFFVFIILLELIFIAHGLFYPFSCLDWADNRENNNGLQSCHSEKLTGFPLGCFFTLAGLYFLLCSLGTRLSVVCC